MRERPVIAGFEIFEEVARGGQAAVYRGRKTTLLDKEVAIKVYDVRRDQLDEGAFRRFHREVAALRSLDGHPHVVRLVEADFTVDGHGFVATEWCTRTLAELIQAGPVPVAEALRLGVQIAEGLAAVHGTEPSILHRDIKPANVFLTADDRVALGDFGTAVFDHPDGGLPTTTRMLTPAFAAPEMLGDERVTARSDIYSLGRTICAMIAGTNQTPPPVAALDLPPAVAAVLSRATSRDPAQRQSTAVEFARELVEAQRRGVPVSTTPMPTAPRTPPTVEAVGPVTPRLLTPPDEPAGLRIWILRLVAAWVLGAAVLVAVGPGPWPWLAPLAVLAMLVVTAVAFLRQENLLRWGVGTGIAAHLAIALASLAGGNGFLAFVSALVGAVYVAAVVAIVRFVRFRALRAEVERRNADCRQRFLTYRSQAWFGASEPPMWLLEILERFPAARIFEFQQTFRYAVVCDQHVVFVAVTRWRPGQYRIVDLENTFQGNRPCPPCNEYLRYVAHHGMRQLHATLSRGLAATVRTALVIGERDGRDREVVLSPTTVGDLTVLPMDSAADYLGNLLGGADPSLVDVDLVQSVHVLAATLDAQHRAQPSARY